MVFKYKVLGTLGQGSYGTVYLATIEKESWLSRFGKSPEEQVAIKVVSRQKLSSKPHLQDLIIQEIQVLKKMNHHFVIQFVNLQFDAEFIYIAMEYCDQKSLRNYLNQKGGRLSEKDARYFQRQLVSGLQYLHSQSLVHRDLKPDNLLLLSCRYPLARPMVKIADFGIAAIQEAPCSSMSGSEPELTKRMGTWHYMAPEILTQDKYDGRCDIWSVGIVFFEMLTGHTPFFSCPNLDTLLKRLESPRPQCLSLPSDISSQVSPDASLLVQSLLTKNPDDRISFQDLFSHSYLDILHVPSPDSYEKGIQLLKETKKMDDAQSHDYQQLRDRYLDSAAYLLAHLDFCCSNDNHSKHEEDQVKDTANQILDRVEKLHK